MTWIFYFSDMPIEQRNLVAIYSRLNALHFQSYIYIYKIYIKHYKSQERRNITDSVIVYDFFQM